MKAATLASPQTLLLRLMLSFAIITVMYTSALLAVAQQQHRGDLFNFVPDLGACGFTNTSTQIVASVSKTVFITFPGATSNPNKNPICTHKILIRSPTGSQNLTAQVVDFFTAPTTNKTVYNIGLSDAGFVHFGELGDGLVPNVTWNFQ